MKRKSTDLDQDRQKRPRLVRSRSHIQRIRDRLRLNTVARFRAFAERRNLPTYELDLTHSSGNLHTVTARPIAIGSNNYSLEAAQRNIANLLRVFTRDEIARQTGWSIRTASYRFRGFLQVTNQMNPTTTQMYDLERLSDITQSKFDEIFSNVQQSESEVPFEFLEWTIVINPTIYNTGSGVEMSSSIPRKGLGWQNYYDAEGHINCAAISLTILTRENRFDRQEELLKK